MNNYYKASLLFTMTLALSFGFMHLFIPEHSFERLHIFMFNLCSGGTILLYYSESRDNPSYFTLAFFVLSMCYAILAYLNYYLPAIFVAAILFVLVERVRIQTFSFFPYQFFSKTAGVSKKFHHASLLCLSIGLIISILAICNHEYFLIIKSEKFQLDTFFLGFSFPLSLITLSVMFSLMDNTNDLQYKIISEIDFWAINLGVIIFFIFILLGSWILELIISIVLLIAVCSVLFLYVRYGHSHQTKAFLTSGIIFLVFTALTGIAYIVNYFTSVSIDKTVLLRFHTILSLYGWNLSGLAVICRYKDFPIQLHSNATIAIHWVTVALLAPLGYYYPVFSILAIISYAYFLYVMFFSKIATVGDSISTD
ncbi:conserved hypothetical protein, membrane [Candidatus Magnetomorum sp. HK-1]|nr:conserved hypothetical protein, membrane [Candidatus Magnetomorum sp. HK-1]